MQKDYYFMQDTGFIIASCISIDGLNKYKTTKSQLEDHRKMHMRYNL